jgi:hypothetical protein
MTGKRFKWKETNTENNKHLHVRRSPISSTFVHRTQFLPCLSTAFKPPLITATGWCREPRYVSGKRTWRKKTQQ